MDVALYSTYRRRHQNCNWKNVRCSTILQYFFKSRSWRHFYAVIREHLAENCRGRTTTIICTRTNAPKYILESHRLHFGSICDQNGRNFEPCLIWEINKGSFSQCVCVCVCVCGGRWVSVIYYSTKMLYKSLKNDDDDTLWELNKGDWWLEIWMEWRLPVMV